MKKLILIVIMFICAALGSMAFAGEPKVIKVTTMTVSSKWKDITIVEYCADGYKFHYAAWGNFGSQVVQPLRQGHVPRDPPQPIKCNGSK